MKFINKNRMMPRYQTQGPIKEEAPSTISPNAVAFTEGFETDRGYSNNGYTKTKDARNMSEDYAYILDELPEPLQVILLDAAHNMGNLPGTMLLALASNNPTLYNKFINAPNNSGVFNTAPGQAMTNAMIIGKGIGKVDAYNAFELKDKNPNAAALVNWIAELKPILLEAYNDPNTGKDKLIDDFTVARIQRNSSFGGKSGPTPPTSNLPTDQQVPKMNEWAERSVSAAEYAKDLIDGDAEAANYYYDRKQNEGLFEEQTEGILDAVEGTFSGDGTQAATRWYKSIADAYRNDVIVERAIEKAAQVAAGPRPVYPGDDASEAEKAVWEQADNEWVDAQPFSNESAAVEETNSNVTQQAISKLWENTSLWENANPLFKQKKASVIKNNPTTEPPAVLNPPKEIKDKSKKLQDPTLPTGPLELEPESEITTTPSSFGKNKQTVYTHDNEFGKHFIFEEGDGYSIRKEVDEVGNVIPNTDVKYGAKAAKDFMDASYTLVPDKPAQREQDVVQQPSEKKGFNKFIEDAGKEITNITRDKNIYRDTYDPIKEKNKGLREERKKARMKNQAIRRKDRGLIKSQRIQQQTTAKKQREAVVIARGEKQLAAATARREGAEKIGEQVTPKVVAKIKRKKGVQQANIEGQTTRREATQEGRKREAEMEAVLAPAERRKVQRDKTAKRLKRLKEREIRKSENNPPIGLIGGGKKGYAKRYKSLKEDVEKQKQEKKDVGNPRSSTTSTLEEKMKKELKELEDFRRGGTLSRYQRVGRIQGDANYSPMMNYSVDNSLSSTGMEGLYEGVNMNQQQEIPLDYLLEENPLQNLKISAPGGLTPPALKKKVVNYQNPYGGIQGERHPSTSVDAKPVVYPTSKRKTLNFQNEYGIHPSSTPEGIQMSEEVAFEGLKEGVQYRMPCTGGEQCAGGMNTLSTNYKQDLYDELFGKGVYAAERLYGDAWRDTDSDKYNIFWTNKDYANQIDKINTGSTKVHLTHKPLADDGSVNQWPDDFFTRSPEGGEDMYVGKMVMGDRINTTGTKASGLAAAKKGEKPGPEHQGTIGPLREHPYLRNPDGTPQMGRFIAHQFAGSEGGSNTSKSKFFQSWVSPTSGWGYMPGENKYTPVRIWEEKEIANLKQAIAMKKEAQKTGSALKEGAQAFGSEVKEVAGALGNTLRGAFNWMGGQKPLAMKKHGGSFDASSNMDDYDYYDYAGNDPIQIRDYPRNRMFIEGEYPLPRYQFKPGTILDPNIQVLPKKVPNKSKPFSGVINAEREHNPMEGWKLNLGAHGKYKVPNSRFTFKGSTMFEPAPNMQGHPVPPHWSVGATGKVNPNIDMYAKLKGSMSNKVPGFKVGAKYYFRQEGGSIPRYQFKPGTFVPDWVNIGKKPEVPAEPVNFVGPYYKGDKLYDQWGNLKKGKEEEEDLDFDPKSYAPDSYGYDPTKLNIYGNKIQAAASIAPGMYNLGKYLFDKPLEEKVIMPDFKHKFRKLDLDLNPLYAQKRLANAKVKANTRGWAQTMGNLQNINAQTQKNLSSTMRKHQLDNMIRWDAFKGKQQAYEDARAVQERAVSQRNIGHKGTHEDLGARAIESLSKGFMNIGELHGSEQKDFIKLTNYINQLSPNYKVIMDKNGVTQVVFKDSGNPVPPNMLTPEINQLTGIRKYDPSKVTIDPSNNKRGGRIKRKKKGGKLQGLSVRRSIPTRRKKIRKTLY